MSPVGTLVLVGAIAGSSLAYAVQTPDAGGQQTEDETVLFSADSVIRERDDAPILAEGNVQAFFGTQTLVADQLTYDPDTDVVIASGNVSIFDGEGQTYFADAVELTGNLRDGVATNFAALLNEQTRLAGSSVVRRSSGRNDINNAAFSACPICDDKGEKKRPTWQVKALRVTQDTNDQTIRFRNAVIEAWGVPVMYTPYLSFPDPAVKRKAGFLTPSIGNSTRSGLEIELPYYLPISDHQDVTFSPRYFSKLGLLAKAEYRVRTHDAGAVFQGGFIQPNGIVRNTVSGSYITEDDANKLVSGNLTVPLANRETDIGPRWHLFGEGFKELDNGWRAEFDIDIVSDKQYLRQYDIEPEGELREAIDVLQPDRLENSFAFVRREADSFTQLSTTMFQSLRTSEDNDFMADAMPHFRHEKKHPVPLVGGEATVGSDFLYLHRPSGLDSARAVVNATYDKSHTTKGGHRFRGFAEVRADHYRYTDADQGIQACNVDDGDAAYEECRIALPREARKEAFTTSRVLPTAGLEWSYPLAKLTDSQTFIIEPKIQAVVSPQGDYTDHVFNEDSQFFQFDGVTLFDWSKSPGLDLWEDGQRLNIGVSGTAIFNKKLTVSGTLGQQYRTETSTAFDSDTGLGSTTSDIVGDVDIVYGRNLTMDNRFRFDKNDGTLRRGESTIRGRMGPFAANLSYLRVEDPQLDATDQRDEFLTTTASYAINDRWTVGGNWRENLAEGETTARSLLLRYRDDCTIFTINYRFDNQTGTDFNQNTSLTFNVDVIGF